MSVSVPTEYILNMGYWPDDHADRGLPPDTLFIHVVFDVAWVRLFERAWNQYTFTGWQGDWGREGARILKHYWDTLADAAAALQFACMEKYRLTDLSPWDCFWSVSPHPEWSWKPCTHDRVQPGGACDYCGVQVYASG